jgi:hypothetical protein
VAEANPRPFNGAAAVIVWTILKDGIAGIAVMPQSGLTMPSPGNFVHKSGVSIPAEMIGPGQGAIRCARRRRDWLVMNE